MANPSGDKLKKIQIMLNKISLPKPFLEENGQWSDDVSNALYNFQIQAKLKATGMVDTETAVVILRYMKTGEIEKEQPIHFLKVSGTIYGFTQKDYDRAKKKIIDNLLKPKGTIAQLTSKARQMEGIWTVYDELTDEAKFVNFVLELVHTPKIPDQGIIKKAIMESERMRSLVVSGNLGKFYADMPKAEIAVNTAVVLMLRHQLFSRVMAGASLTTLKIVKTSAFIFVGVFAAPVAATTFGTGALASAVIGNAAVAFVETSSTELGKGLADEKGFSLKGAVTNVAVDTGVGAVTGVFNKGGKGGKHFYDAAITRVFKDVVKKEGIKLLSKQTAKKLTIYMMTEGAKGATEGAIKDVAKMLKGDPNMSWAKAADNIGANFAKGSVFGPISGVLSKYGEGKIPDKYKDKIWMLALKVVAKSSKKGELNMADVTKKTQDLGAKLLGDAITKGLDSATKNVVGKLSGELSAAQFAKKLEEQLFSSSQVKIYAAIIAKNLGKEILKGKK